MAHHHNYGLTLLKTPKGYLTKNGFTNDINDSEIIILRSNTYGIWASIKHIVEYFIKESENPSKITEELKDYPFDNANFEVKSYWCGQNICNGCHKYNNELHPEYNCKFWHGHRDELKYSRIY